MIVDRKEFAKTMKLAARGLSAKSGMVEGSDLFSFDGSKITTFNGVVRVQMKCDVDLRGSIPSIELMALVNRFTTDTIDVSMQPTGHEILVVGAGGRAGITCGSPLLPDTSQIPSPGKWFVPSDQFVADLSAASKVCGQDDSMGVTVCVRILPDRIEACDNYRVIRIVRPTGLPEEFYLQASSVAALEGLKVLKVNVSNGWMHVRVEDGMLSLRGRVFAEYPNLDPFIAIDGDEIHLPKELAEGITRSQVFTEKHSNSAQMKYVTRVNIRLTQGIAKISTGSSRGWFEEDLKLDYKGPDLAFDAHPDSLLQILDHSFAVRFERGKLVAKTDDTCMVISTRVPNV